MDGCLLGACALLSGAEKAPKAWKPTVRCRGAQRGRCEKGCGVWREGGTAANSRAHAVDTAQAVMVTSFMRAGTPLAASAAAAVAQMPTVPTEGAEDEYLELPEAQHVIIEENFLAVAPQLRAAFEKRYKGMGLRPDLCALLVCLCRVPQLPVLSLRLYLDLN